jgi:hypothetical protein
MPSCKGKQLKRHPRHVRNLLNRHVIDLLGYDGLDEFFVSWSLLLTLQMYCICVHEVAALIDSFEMNCDGCVSAL